MYDTHKGIETYRGHNYINIHVHSNIKINKTRIIINKLT